MRSSWVRRSDTIDFQRRLLRDLGDLKRKYDKAVRAIKRLVAERKLMQRELRKKARRPKK
jgi:hypothetical protein